MTALRRRSEFERILLDYRVSARGRTLLNKLRLVILNGPSGTGRNTIIKRLIARGDYHFIVSDTTRKPRVNDGQLEQNGVDYWFRSENEILKDLRAGEFLEAEIIHNQQVSGISLRELERAQAQGKIAIDDVEIGGFNEIISSKPDTVAILLLPPSFKEWLHRLHERSDLPQSEIRNRLETGIRIFTEALVNPQVLTVINDNLTRAVDEVDRLAMGSGLQDSAAKLELAERLLKDTEHHLED